MLSRILSQVNRLNENTQRMEFTAFWIWKTKRINLTAFGIGIHNEWTYCVLEKRFSIRKYINNLKTNDFFGIRKREVDELGFYHPFLKEKGKQ